MLLAAVAAIAEPASINTVASTLLPPSPVTLRISAIAYDGPALPTLYEPVQVSIPTELRAQLEARQRAVRQPGTGSLPPGTVEAASVPAVASSDAQMAAFLLAHGWSAELVEEAGRIVRKESGYHPSSENGMFKGLFQMQWPFWWNHCGADPSLWADPVAHVAVALCVVRYDLAQGYGPFSQWEQTRD